MTLARASPSSPTSARRATASPRTGSSAPTGCATTGATCSSRALIEHIKLTLIAVAHRLRDLARRGAPRAPAAPRRAAVRASRRCLHDPEPGALPAARPGHRPDGHDRRGRARRLHAADPLPEHPRRACARRRPTCSKRHADGADAARRRSGASSCRWRCPRSWPGSASPSSRRSRSPPSPRSSIPQGLGCPIFLALREAFKTEIIVAGALAVGLALVADGLLVLAERALTPWARARRTA